MQTSSELLSIIHELWVILYNHSVPDDEGLYRARVRILAKVEPMIEHLQSPFAIPEEE